MKKRFFILLALLCHFRNHSIAQNNPILWQKTIGGTGDDRIMTMKQTTDEGFIIGGVSNSAKSGNKTDSSWGDYDYWVVKMNKKGGIQWQKTLGGTKSEVVQSIQQTLDGGYIVGGSSNSPVSGNKTVDTKGLYDFWIVKLNAQGNIQWQKSIGGTDNDMFYSISQTSDGGYIVGGQSNSGAGGDKIDTSYGVADYWVLKLNATGVIQWQKSFGGTRNDVLQTVQQTKDGGYIVGGYSESDSSTVGHKTERAIGHYDYWVLKLNASGNVQWQNTIGSQNQDLLIAIGQTNDKGYILAGYSNSAKYFDKSENSMGGNDYWIVKIDSTGSVKWDNTIGGALDDNLSSIQFTKDGGCILGGLSTSNISGDKHEKSFGNYDYWAVKIDAAGKVQWDKTMGGALHDQMNYITELRDGTYMMGGFSSSFISGNKTENPVGYNDYWLLNVRNPFVLSGNIFIDLNNNCIQNAGSEKGMRNYSIKMTRDGYNTFTSSDKSGNYYFVAPDTGMYNIQLLSNPTNRYFWTAPCNSYAIHIKDTSQVKDFALNSTNCPHLTIDLATYHCGHLHGYTINYCNYGTADANNAYIDISIDRALQILNQPTSTVPYTSLGNSMYRLQLGTVEYGTCGIIHFDLEASYSHIPLGQTICSEAHIYPDSLCYAASYRGPFIYASAICHGDSVQFTLTNTGKGNMNSNKHYRIIEDNTIRFEGDYLILAGAKKNIFTKVNNGASYTILADQPNELPGMYNTRFAAAHIEGCLLVAPDTLHTGFVTQFPAYDGEDFRAVDCWINKSSFDPNDKTGFPFGYGPQHFIEANTDIDYIIRFQNTGNDTARFVYVVDTISPWLNINTLEPGASSHNYAFVRIDSNVVKFVFDHINLVDSNTNELLSHGFIKYRIQQKTDNPIGTKIYNSADIFFDENVPVKTNVTMHTIGHDFIQVQLISGVYDPKFNISGVKVFPNPFHDKTQIIMEGDKIKDASLLLMNVEGKILKTIQPEQENHFDIYREDIPVGLYIYKIIQENETVASGKLMVQ